MEPKTVEPLPTPARGRTSPEATFYVLAGVTLCIGLLISAYAYLAPATFFGPAFGGLAVLSWGVGILMIFLALASRRVREAVPKRWAQSRPAPGGLTTERPRARRSSSLILLEARLLVLSGGSFFVGVLLFALPSFFSYSYFPDFLLALGVALVLWGLGILFLFLSLAARSIRES